MRACSCVWGVGSIVLSEDEESFILTTDADVLFTPDSVEALLDLMTRDQTIGAVCARTHPTGGGPLVWYQLFEYAIGHWFQKVAKRRVYLLTFTNILFCFYCITR